MLSQERVLKDEILLYQTEDGKTRIDVCLQDETLWLTQMQMTELFQKDKRTISEHIANIYEEGELSQEATVRKFRTVQKEGSREVKRDLVSYNLDVIISVGYRVKSIDEPSLVERHFMEVVEAVKHLETENDHS